MLPDNFGPGAADLFPDPENTVLKLLVRLRWRLLVLEPEDNKVKE